MNKYIIIVAGGSGSRMQSKIPKQFLLLADKPILMHTINVFKNFDKKCKIVLVLPENNLQYWEKLCAEYHFETAHEIVKGGKTRFHSVLNGLNAIEEDALVAVHDGVRPLVSISTIRECFTTAEEKGNAIPVILLNDSIRKINITESHAVERKNYRLVQTPQCFKTELLKKAYTQKYSDHFTDDASVVEGLGVKINLVQGNLENIKITTETDLKIAHAFFKED